MNNDLHWACWLGDIEDVQLLLEIGYDYMPLMSKVMLRYNNGHLKIVKALIKAGADIDRANNSGNTPLKFASLNGHTEIVKLLKERGARFRKNKEEQPDE